MLAATSLAAWLLTRTKHTELVDWLKLARKLQDQQDPLLAATSRAAGRVDGVGTW